MDVKTDKPLSLGGLTQRVLSSAVSVASVTPEEIAADCGLPFTGGALLVCSLWLKAYKGDVNAAKLIREMNGETDSSVQAADLSKLSDEALLALAGDFDSAEKEAADSLAAEGSHDVESENERPSFADEIPW
ncbi:MAG: hypothetical protein Q4F31_09390 [Eubacteriales bacterium]|nr:hypothetical protein [Eubacteriales bacterium]